MSLGGFWNIFVDAGKKKQPRNLWGTWEIRTKNTENTKSTEKMKVEQENEENSENSDEKQWKLRWKTKKTQWNRSEQTRIYEFMINDDDDVDDLYEIRNYY